MKKNLFPMVAAMAILGFAACNDSADKTTETTTDTTTTGSQMNSSSSMSSDMSTMDPDPSASYVELKTGKSVKLRRDTVSRYIVNETNQEVPFYVNTATNDTFDRSGRVVNNALMRGDNGDWTVDESRIKVKTQDDGDVKMKDRDDDTKVKLETNGDAKIKTDTSKTKIKDGKVKDKKN